MRSGGPGGTQTYLVESQVLGKMLVSSGRARKTTEYAIRYAFDAGLRFAFPLLGSYLLHQVCEPDYVETEWIIAKVRWKCR